jgi:CBS domain-containing protein
MNPDDTRVRDLMIAVDEYAVVDATATLREALDVLGEAQRRMEDGGHRHRAVLVRDARNRIIGKVGHLAFLRAVRTAAVDPLASDPRLEVAGVDEDMVRQSAGVYRMMHDDLRSLCGNASSVRVREAMRPVEEHIDADASLLDALDAFDRWESLSLLVTDGRETVGILRLVDLFDEVARSLMTCCDHGAEGV